MIAANNIVETGDPVQDASQKKPKPRSIWADRLVG